MGKNSNSNIYALTSRGLDWAGNAKKCGTFVRFLAALYISKPDFVYNCPFGAELPELTTEQDDKNTRQKKTLAHQLAQTNSSQTVLSVHQGWFKADQTAPVRMRPELTRVNFVQV